MRHTHIQLSWRSICNYRVSLFEFDGEKKVCHFWCESCINLITHWRVPNFRTKWKRIQINMVHQIYTRRDKTRQDKTDKAYKTHIHILTDYEIIHDILYCLLFRESVVSTTKHDEFTYFTFDWNRRTEISLKNTLSNGDIHVAHIYWCRPVYSTFDFIAVNMLKSLNLMLACGMCAIVCCTFFSPLATYTKSYARIISCMCLSLTMLFPSFFMQEFFRSCWNWPNR